VRRAAALLLCALAAGCAPAPRDDQPKRQHDPNPASIGFIDIPADGATVEPAVRVSGWAADESSVKAVRIYFDDELMATAPMVTARPDINKAYPRFARPDMLHGFEAMIDAGAHAGYTTIRAVAIDGKGAQSQIYSINVKIRE
jgi:Bacterial Ig domain